MNLLKAARTARRVLTARRDYEVKDLLVSGAMAALLVPVAMYAKAHDLLDPDE